MRATLIMDGKIGNLEVPLVREEVDVLLRKAEKRKEDPAELAKRLILSDEDAGEKYEIAPTQAAAIKRDIIVAFMTATGKADATYVIDQVSKLVNFCLTNHK